MTNHPWRNDALHIISPSSCIFLTFFLSLQSALTLSSSGTLKEQSPGSKQKGLWRQKAQTVYINSFQA